MESLDEPGAAEEAQWMRAVVVGLLRDVGPASSAGSTRAQQVLKCRRHQTCDSMCPLKINNMPSLHF